MIPRGFQSTLDRCDAFVLLATIKQHGAKSPVVDEEALLTKWGIEAYLGWPRDRIERAARVLEARGQLRFVR